MAENGDLANWMIPGKMVKGMVGAMDLLAGGKEIVVIMDHNAKDGSANFLKHCDLPLTGSQVVDMLISDLGVFKFDRQQATLVELLPGVTVDDVCEKSEAAFVVHSSLK